MKLFQIEKLCSFSLEKNISTCHGRRKKIPKKFDIHSPLKDFYWKNEETKKKGKKKRKDRKVKRLYPFPFFCSPLISQEKKNVPFT